MERETRKYNIQIIQTLQNKVVREIVSVLWYDHDNNIHQDLKGDTVKEEIKSRYTMSRD